MNYMGLKSFRRKIRKTPPSVLLTTGFLSIILTGTALLLLPVSTTSGISITDAFFVATSAVCVTGLSPIDVSTSLTLFGQGVLMTLFQIGGLGYALLLVVVITAANGSLSFRNKALLRESFGMDNRMKVSRVIRFVLLLTFISEGVGTILLSIPFVRDHGSEGVFIALFTSVSAFNNAGFDLFGNSLIGYADSAAVLIPVALLIITGGVGFLVLREIIVPGKGRKKLSVHTKVVILMTLLLLATGTAGFIFLQGMNPLEAFFQAVTTRTAGFTTFDQSTLTPVAFMMTIMLMFIGASPCSTGGGIKTSTFFALLQGIKSAATNKSEKAFRYALPKDAFKKAAIIALLSVGVIAAATFLFMAFEPTVPFSDALFEMVSAFGTVGLTTGITPTIGTAAKLLSMVIMYIGRLGPLTVATLWYFSRGERVRFPEGNLSIG